jgi:hypothetical protein
MANIPYVYGAMKVVGQELRLLAHLAKWINTKVKF